MISGDVKLSSGVSRVQVRLVVDEGLQSCLKCIAVVSGPSTNSMAMSRSTFSYMLILQGIEYQCFRQLLFYQNVVTLLPS